MKILPWVLSPPNCRCPNRYLGIRIMAVSFKDEVSGTYIIWLGLISHTFVKLLKPVNLILQERKVSIRHEDSCYVKNDCS